MAQDYDSGIPIRSEADGADERVQVKIVDKNNPTTQQMTVDADSNAHVEVHGNDEANTDRVIATNEKGNIALDGDYDVGVNTNPSSSGLIAHDRNGAGTDRTHQNKRVTAVLGQNNTVCVDVALHDELGQVYSANNPLPVTLEESEGEEIHAFKETEDLVYNTSTTLHVYTVATGKTFLLDQVLVSGSGKLKVVLEIGDGAVSETFLPKAINFNSTAVPSAPIDLAVPIVLVGTATGTTVKVTITNRDLQNQDVHSTIIGRLRNT